MNIQKYDPKLHGEPLKKGGRANKPEYDTLAASLKKSPQVIQFEVAPKASFRTSIAQSMKSRGLEVSIRTLTDNRLLISKREEVATAEAAG